MKETQQIGAKIIIFRARNKKVMIDEQEEQQITTSFTIPKKLNDLLKQDAKRCRRSTVGQLVAILGRVYLDWDVELHGTENYTPSIEVLKESERKAA